MMIKWLVNPWVALATLCRFSMWNAAHNYTLYRRIHERGMTRIARKLAMLNTLLTGADISASALIGDGLRLPHPNGVVIGGLCRIGCDCMIYQQATLGYRADDSDEDGHPELGEGVVVGAGARILGAITVGDRARIGANAVVIQDVPAGALAVGIPARVKRHNGEHQE